MLGHEVFLVEDGFLFPYLWHLRHLNLLALFEFFLGFLCSFLQFGCSLRSRLDFFLGEHAHLYSQGSEVGEREDSADLGHVVQVKVFPDGITCEEEFGLGVVDDMRDISGLEVLQDRHDNGSVGEDSHVGHGPVATVAADEGDLVVFLYTALAKKNMQALNLSSHLAVGVNLRLPVIAHCRAIPMHADSILK